MILCWACCFFLFHLRNIHNLISQGIFAHSVVCETSDCFQSGVLTAWLNERWHYIQTNQILHWDYRKLFFLDRFINFNKKKLFVPLILKKLMVKMKLFQIFWSLCNVWFHGKHNLCFIPEIPLCMSTQQNILTLKMHILVDRNQEPASGMR